MHHFIVIEPRHARLRTPEQQLGLTYQWQYRDGHRNAMTEVRHRSGVRVDHSHPWDQDAGERRVPDLRTLITVRKPYTLWCPVGTVFRARADSRDGGPALAISMRVSVSR